MAKEDVMIKSQLVVEIADRAGLTRQQAKAALDALIQTVEENLIQGRRVQITGFGTFEVRVRAPRRGVDPRTRQPLEFPETRYPFFKAGQALKRKVGR